MAKDPSAMVDYGYANPGETGMAPEIWQAVLALLQAQDKQQRVLDLGCGNGYRTDALRQMGFTALGIEPSQTGVEVARKHYPDTEFALGSSDDDLRDQHGQFDIIMSLEVIEHVYSIAQYTRCLRALLKPGGIAILSTPYHGWLKNVAIAVLGKFDAHVNPLWEGGHIKFFSEATLRLALGNAGLQIAHVARVGRIPPLAKSMLVVAKHS